MGDMNIDEKLADGLAHYGISLTDAMERMDGNIDLYEKLAMKYLDDTNYVDLVAAMDVKDFDTGYKSAHALKGVSGNLSLVRLFEVASIVSDALHQGEYQAAEEHMPELKEANDAAITGLEKWRDGAF